MSGGLFSTRRGIIRGVSALGLSAAGFTALPAFTAQRDDYKALVCVMLNGGLDNFDSMIPADADGYALWAKRRVSMLDHYSRIKDVSRDRSTLTPLSGRGGANHGFVSELAPLADLYAKGQLAVVANVGPLIGPTTRASLEANEALRPPRLASHSDQYAMWSTLNLEGTNVGWAGQFLDRLAVTSSFSSISFAGVEALGQGRGVSQLALSGPSIEPIPGMTPTPGRRPSAIDELLRDHLRSRGVEHDDVLMRDVAREQTRAVQQAAFMRAIIHDNPVGKAVVIKGNKLSEQLASVMAMIDARKHHEATRQVFVVELQGFDTHQSQALSLPGLQRKLAEALGRFSTVLEERGVSDQVTTFTVSDFGRTLAANASGTDHGWGGHHFVMGGAVKGGRVVGELTPPTLDHGQAWAKRGGLIPTLAIEQYGAALGRWFGVGASDLRTVFPNLSRFDAGAVDLFTS